MSFNLIRDPWLPVRRLSGGREWIVPAELTSRFVDDPIVALDFPRPDWNAAVLELLIGFMATVMPPEDTSSWAEHWATPPSPDIVREKLGSIAFAFNLDGDGPRCFQDFDPLADLVPKPIAALLIDSPGQNAEDKNTDLFVKRAGDTAMSPAIVAAALVTLQTFAPAGGQGNRTSMRGGGPLTTLPLPRRKVGAAPVTTLWDLVWASVPVQSWVGDLPDEPDDEAWFRIFPWLAASRTSEKDRATLPEHGHPLQHFFATPRRIRLDATAAAGGTCSFEGPSGETLFRTFRQKNFGVKYEGWLHPLTPYRHDRTSGLLAFHPQPGGDTYRDWIAWVENPREKTTQRAACLEMWSVRLDRLRRMNEFVPEFQAGEPWQSGVLALGFDMDSMKARGWLDARVPFFDPPPDRPKWSDEFRTTAERLVAGTEEAAKALRGSTKVAVAGVRDRDGRYRIPETLPRDAFAELIEELWRETEPAFRHSLAKLRDTPADETKALREAFLKVLRKTALSLFDQAAGTDTLADRDARRIVESRSNLQLAFAPRAAVSRALDIAPAPDPSEKPKGKGRKTKTKDSADV